ncbi:MAG TPA: guanylate kinase [Candidatus Binatia bacterium]|jgi:guanylate kinase
MASYSLAHKRKGILFIISGPSGVGKTTLIKRLLKSRSDITLSVSCTTRPQRPEERAGRDYHFVTEKRFAELRAHNGFAEWANVHGALYGTPRLPVERRLNAGRDVLLEIDVQGTRKIKYKYPHAVAIFLMPPTWTELGKRLARRGTDGRKTMLKRLENARREMLQFVRYDYVVVNSDLAAAIESTNAIILAERLRVARRLLRR